MLVRVAGVAAAAGRATTCFVCARCRSSYTRRFCWPTTQSPTWHAAQVLGEDTTRMLHAWLENSRRHSRIPR